MTTPSSPLTHFDGQGQAHMVDVGAKPATRRTAVATPHIDAGRHPGADSKRHGFGRDVLGVARIAAIMAAKKPAT